MIERPQFLTIKQFAEKHPVFTQSSLRWLRFNQGTNGFADAFRCVGRRVLINEDRFFELIEEQNSRTAKGAA